MSGLLNDYFGPLGREYCLYFYLMSIFFFVMIVLGVIGIISAIVYKPKKFDMLFLMHSFMLMFNAILAYYVNRLLNTMCMNSTH
jgi:hypothetical protein